MNTLVTTNQYSKLYIIPCGGGGHTCFGFDNCMRDTKALARILCEPAPEQNDWGTIELYVRYQSLCRRYGEDKKLSEKTWYDPDTDPKVIRILERLRKMDPPKDLVRVAYGDRITGRSWLDEWGCIGRIGRSSGWMKIPLLVPDGECGGPGMLEASIVLIMDFRGESLYRHPKFHAPPMEMREGNEKGLKFEVWIDGECHCRFKTEPERSKWVLFQQGHLFDYMPLYERVKLEREEAE